MSAGAASSERSTTRLLAGLRSDGHAVTMAAHAQLWGPIPLELRPDELRARVAASGLTGRGGAGFPTAAKLESVAGSRLRPVVLANGAEGEPPSGKDKALLAYVPQLVLDGALLAARAVGADRVVLATTSTVHATVVRALAERPRVKRISVEAAVVPDRFVTGEETALVHLLNGGPAVPTYTPPRPYERGIGDAPTVVLNVETLAHLALVARFGPGWFRALGTAEEPGTALVTLSGAVREPGVYEIELGSPLGRLLDQAGADATAQACLVGGYFGTWISAADARSVALSNAALSRVGAALGARAIVVLPQASCGIVETARVARYLSDESAGQCGPCVNGLAAIATSLEGLVRRPRATTNMDVLRRRLLQVAGRGACRHPDGAVTLVASALRVFSDELERHLRGRGCQRQGHPVLPVP